HLINCQFKWMDRIRIYPATSTLDWWNPVYPMDELASYWDKSLQPWLDLLAEKSEAELLENVVWIGVGNKPYTSPLKDLALQLNYHSIHHRAQMQLFIRQQGLTPDFVDYIGTIYKPI
ncbi:MAG TPA: DinB family protein, partial [Chitinophagales bacterium]|nr:DinB family protein [Chitinophagales bacterium]